MSGGEPNEERRITRRYTSSFIARELSPYLTPNAKVNTSLSLKAMYYMFLKYWAEKTNTSMSYLVNMLLSVLFNECEKSCKVMDEFYKLLNQSTSEENQ